MPLNPDKLLSQHIPPVEQTYGPKDCILYALGVGFGYDPLSENELPFVNDKNLKAVPTFPLVLGYTPFWQIAPDLGVTSSHAVHGEQTIVLHAPVATQGTIIGHERITDVIDKGAAKGALLYHERAITDKTSGKLLATLKQTTFCRADGGFGGPARETPPPYRIPDRAPDIVYDLPTRPEMALIYRLSGDTNPLHAEPAFAREAGFPRPILHGLATMGVAGHAILKTMCSYDPARLTSMTVRFSAPVYPGETIRTELWQDRNKAGTVVSFRVRVKERDVVAINSGRAEIRD